MCVGVVGWLRGGGGGGGCIELRWAGGRRSRSCLSVLESPRGPRLVTRKALEGIGWIDGWMDFWLKKKKNGSAYCLHFFSFHCVDFILELVLVIGSGIYY